MSDPVTNSEVEDVLSSIRRLVSEDKRPLQAPVTERATDRLVLTPALRVHEQDEHEKDADADTGAHNAPASLEAPVSLNTDVDPEATAPVQQLGSLATDGPDFDAAAPAPFIAVADDFEDVEDIDAQAEPFEDIAEDYSADPYDFDDADAATSEEDTDTVSRPQSVEARYDWTEETAGTDDADEGVLVTYPASEEQSSTEPVPDHTPQENDAQQVPATESKAVALSAKIAALETAIGDIADSFEADEAGEGENTETELAAMAWEDDAPEEAPAPRLHFAPFAKPASEDVVEASEVEAVEDDDDLETSAPERAPFGTEIAETERPETVANVAQQAEQVSQSSDPLEFGTGQPQDVREETSVEEAATPVADQTNDEIGLGLADEAQLIDEEALRDLVSEIVRAELQGALGERITRNVRKLVRREIHRALTAQELE